MSKDSVGVEGTPKHSVTTGRLSTKDYASTNQKGDSHSRTVSIKHLDRTGGFTHEHYSQRDVVAANHAKAGADHE